MMFINSFWNTVAPPPAIPTPIRYYKMENNVLDSMGGNGGIANNITYTSGLVGQTAVFNGSNSWVDLNNSNFSFGNGTTEAPFSISLMYKRNGSTTNNELFSKRTIATREYVLGYFSGQILCRVYSGGGNTIYKNLAYTVNLGTTWHNIIMAYDGIKLYLYLNGVLVSDTTVTTGNYVAMLGTAVKGWIGSMSGASNFFANGSIDEVGVFNVAINASQAEAINTKLVSGQSLV